MKTWLKLAAAALLTVAIAVLLVGAVAAQSANPQAITAAEPMCDYCADYTDAATSAGAVQSAYRPVLGYEAPYDRAATTDRPHGAGYLINSFRVESK